jgi:NAD(P)-dependent dehydrogenase (short-subunit alcohol dehydrogenase family)
MARAKVAFVTGGGRGIGRACALRLAKDGLAVAVGSRTESQGRGVATEITRAGGTAIAVRLDVSDPESVGAAFESAETALGPVDVLVCAAVNLMGPVLCARAVLHGMIERNFGRIVVLGSTASFVGAPYVGAYTASKHGVLGFVRALAAETVRKDVTVNCVCPGYVDTPMTDATVARIAEKTGRSADEARKALEAMNPGGRLLRPEEVAEAVAWLAREESSVVNGQAVVLGGGAIH